MWFPATGTTSPGSSGTAGLGPIQRRLHLDCTLLGMLVTLSGLGLVVLYSAFGESLVQVERQLVRLAVAFAVLVVVAQFPPETLRRWAPWLFGASLALLVAVLVAGELGGGARRWLNLGVLRFQPSELMKIALPLMIARLLAAQELPPRLGRTALALVLIALPAGLIAAQPDLGTSILVAAAGSSVLFLAGLRWRILFGLIAALAATAPLLWQFGMQGYQRERVLTFLDPERDPLGAGYNIIQSKIAIGSGGLYGKGWLNGTQAHLDFIPERHTDFVFAVLAEEFGFMGVVLVLALYFAVVARGLWVAHHAQDSFGRLLAGGLALTFFVYFFVNIGMVSGVLPVVGLPLPLISFGGSSLVTLLAGFGILMSIHTHRRLWSS